MHLSNYVTLMCKKIIKVGTTKQSNNMIYSIIKEMVSVALTVTKSVVVTSDGHEGKLHFRHLYTDK